jgi:acetyl esterase/lipase
MPLLYLSAAKPIIFVCVAYSQAPDRPFPMAIIEALSVVDYFLTSSSSRKIHIDGISAGGNLALVAALETHRRYPGRVVSVRAQAPMLCPSADSMSYYMNSRSSWFVPTGWLRWSWQSYLSMEHSPLPANKDGEDVPNLEDTTTMEQVLKRDSNDTLWSNSKWNQNPSTRRLIEPMTDVPNKGPSSWQEDSTKFLIVVNKADPLCDDGLAMAKALEEAGASVKLFEHTGTHIVGSMLDKEGNEKGNKAWAEAVFG